MKISAVILAVLVLGLAPRLLSQTTSHQAHATLGGDDDDDDDDDACLRS